MGAGFFWSTQGMRDRSDQADDGALDTFDDDEDATEAERPEIAFFFVCSTQIHYGT